MKKNLIKIFLTSLILILILNIKTFAASNATITGDNIRLRKEKNTSSKILKVLDKNEKVEIVDEDGEWVKIKSGDQTGYINKQYIKTSNDKNNDSSENNTTSNEKNTTENTKNNTTTDNTAKNTNTANNTNQSNNTTNNTNTNDSNTVTNSADNSNKNNQANTPDSANSNQTIEKQQITISNETSIKIMPLINSDEINKAQNGEKYDVIAVAGNWTYIKNEQKQGWIFIQNSNNIANETKTTNTTGNTQNNTTTENTNTTNNTDTNNANASNNTTNTADDSNNTTSKDDNKKETSKTYYVKGTSVNARSKADKKSDVVKKFNTNDQVTVVGDEGAWYIVDINGKKAYIQKALLATKKVETTSRSSNSLDEANNDESEEQKDKNQSANSESAKISQVATGSSTSGGNNVVSYAKTLLGSPYVYGTNGPKSFDCSGFVQYVYKHCGYSISRSSQSQASEGTEVSKSNLQPGDVLIFKNTGGTRIGHVGIYIGDGQFIHASNPKTGVKISSLSSGSYVKRYVTARRIIK